MMGAHERDAVRDWIYEWADEETGKEMMASLPSLPTGTAWVWAPELGVLKKTEVPQITTYDSGRPEEANRKGPTLAPIDVAAMRGKLEVIVKEAIESDPKRLKAKIPTLERAINTNPPSPPPPHPPQP